MHSKYHHPFARLLNVRVLSAAVLASLLVGPIIAQPSSGTKEDEPLVLPAFLVETDRATGYGAANAFTVSRVDTPLREVPQNVAVLTDVFLRDTASFALGDAVRYVPNIRQNQADIQGTSFRMRGFDTRWLARDGFIRYRSPVLAGADRVEVIKGAATLLYGRSGPGGVVNYVTKRAQFQDRYSARITAGSYDFKYGEVDLNKLVTDKFAVRVVGMAQRYDGWRDFERDDQDFALLTARWRPNSRFNWSVSAEFFKRTFNPGSAVPFTSDRALNRAGNPVGLGVFQNEMIRAAANAGQLPGVTGLVASNFGLPNLTEEQKLWVQKNIPAADRLATTAELPRGRRFNFRGDDDLTNDIMTFNTELSYVASEWLQLRLAAVRFQDENTFLTQFPFGEQLLTGGNVDPRGPALDLAFQAARNSNFFTGVQADALFTYDASWTQTKLLIGAEYFRDSFRAPRFNGVVTVDGATQPRYYTREQGLIRRSEGSVVANTPVSEPRTRGAYANLQSSFFKERLRLVGGVKYSRYEQVAHGGANRVTAPMHKNSPIVGVIVSPAEWVSFYAMTGKDFQPFGAGGTTRDGSVLPPEEGTSKEVGAKLEFLGGKLISNISVFDTRITGRAVPEAIGSPFSVAGGELRGRGIDFDLMWQPVNNYQIVLGYGYTDSFVAGIGASPSQRIGEAIANVPPHNFSFWNRYDFRKGPLDGMFVGGGVVYSDESRVSDNFWITAMNDSYVTADVLLGYRFAPAAKVPAEITLNVRNLFDEEYQNGTIACDPRRIFVSASVRF